MHRRIANNAVATIEDQAFNSCSLLTTLLLQNNNITDLPDDPFAGLAVDSFQLLMPTFLLPYSYRYSLRNHALYTALFNTGRWCSLSDATELPIGC